jgi:hypothetical protein
MKKAVKLTLIVFCILFAQNIFAQSLTQKVKGKVFDNESQSPLAFASVVILNTEFACMSDEKGNYKFENVPVGRYQIEVSFLGYYSIIVPEVLVTSAKETVLDVSLKQSISKIDAVTVSGSRKDLPNNSMANLSARSFSVEETRRYAGGLDDPARMASAFAGVTVGNMQDNAIVIRGNSPKGVSWRLEGIEIPNPNHFAGGNVAGGGFVTIFSSQLLANSDFFTGAFPAEYGNALAGVFDMKLRNGNSDTREHTVQIGMLGIDVASEGPFSKGKKATYLFNYRYSTTGLVSSLGLIPTQQIPKYQDLSFKLNFPTEKAGTFALWGIGGIDVNTEPEELDSTKWEYNWDRINYVWNLNTGAAGFSHKYILGTKTFINTTIGASGTQNSYDEKLVDNTEILRQNSYFEDNSSKVTFNTVLNHKFNAKNTIRIGFNQNQLYYKLNLNTTNNGDPNTYQNYVKEDGTSSYSEFFIQSKYDITEKITVSGGINTNYFALNNDYSIDPRLSLKWKFATNHSLSFGYGKHSQLEELRMYLIKETVGGITTYPNKNLDLSHAHHFVLGYEWLLNKNLRLKIEPYYQYLYNVPGIENSSWSMINFSQDWGFRNELQNNSVGKNMGVDITFERFLNNNYYYLITASIFDSKYKADDGIWRNTRFNKGIVCNVLYGKEFFLKKNQLLGINGRLNYMGGERYSPILTNESIQEKRIITDETKAFSKQFPATYNMDITISYRKNKAKTSSVIALQLKNALGSPMYSGYDYNIKTKKIDSSKTVVILPILSYKLEF